MAPRGPKPKPTHLHVIDGTLNTTRHAHRADEPELIGALQKPKYLKGRAVKLWDEVAAACHWLGDADSYKLGMWCALQAEFEKSPKDMTSARIAQLRALGSELGLDPSSRSRLGSMKGNRVKTPSAGGEAESPQPRKGYFDR